MSSQKHVPVLIDEVLDHFEGVELKVFFDGTIGAGGHAEAILQAHPEIETYIGCDRDGQAHEIAGEKLAPFKEKVKFFRGNFADLDQALEELGIEQVDGFFFDLGVSSMQLDQGERGFSFQKEGELDMRQDRRETLTAKEIVNHWPEKKLGEIFRVYGEERRWRQAAQAIVEERRNKKFETTKELAELIEKKVGRSKKKLHPATLIFQALRIVVNKELESVERGIAKAMEFLAPGGRIGAISFHRLEDSIVKNLFRDASRSIEKNKAPLMHLLTKKPIVASLEEQRRNRRSRSAKLRFAEKAQ
ncbi:MAG: 16S rRNA (cytosine(1402)-N(4))-methyltransferase RsmH [Simkaniaceae bacterium]|nr:16S rRNA (cytosine(1402)-N(4))-methyltransferase RsmH [Simkaniaceae bacterium]